ncbi:hypothetical protein ACFL1G_01020 [Planctomycetota bacterium]
MYFGYRSGHRRGNRGAALAARPQTQQKAFGNQEVDIIKSSVATMDIIPQLAVVDAIQLGSAPPGTVHRFSLAELAGTVRLSSSHDINFVTALQMAKEWGYNIPADIRIYEIEVKELLRFSQGCTSESKAMVGAYGKVNRK